MICSIDVFQRFFKKNDCKFFSQIFSQKNVSFQTSKYSELNLTAYLIIPPPHPISPTLLQYCDENGRFHYNIAIIPLYCINNLLVYRLTVQIGANRPYLAAKSS